MGQNYSINSEPSDPLRVLSDDANERICKVKEILSRNVISKKTTKDFEKNILIMDGGGIRSLLYLNYLGLMEEYSGLKVLY